MSFLSLEHLLAARLSYGVTPGMMADLKQRGLEAWLEEQLHPDAKADAECEARVRKMRWPLEYGPGGEKDKKWPATKEYLALQHLESPAAELWKLQDYERPMPFEMRVRPLDEVRAATWIRAAYSKWQVREILAGFWHNHFNVNAEKTETIAAMLPLYDREVIRAHALGNFREMLEAVATSTAMLYYLDNVVSKASPANENYARELFELHTLGAGAYRNDLYKRWREVPGAKDGKPEGYIDQDVYEAARAFTGWTVANNEEDERGRRPNTGEFLYLEGWHDPYQKRVLAAEFDPNQPPMADGRAVLDLVADHPATAQHVCLKLCRRFLGDEPPTALVQKAAKVWRESAKAPDQIARVIRAIVLAPEFAAHPRGKVKNPMELAVSFVRATGAHFHPTPDFANAVQSMGYRLFNWPTPTGHPDVNAYWLGTNTTVGRWNLLRTLRANEHRSTYWERTDVFAKDEETPAQFVARWSQRLTGATLSGVAAEKMVTYLAQVTGGKKDASLDREDGETWERSLDTLAMIGSSPEFQMR